MKIVSRSRARQARQCEHILFRQLVQRISAQRFQQLYRRSLSATCTSMAKRSQKPLYIKKAAPNDPSSIYEFAEAAKVKLDRKPTISTPGFVNELQDLGFTSIPTVVDVLQDLADAIENLPAHAAFKIMATRKGMPVEFAFPASVYAIFRD
jgi:hypothetical protein